MASKYCDTHGIWYDYNEGCPECTKIPKIAGSIAGGIIGLAIGGTILAGKKIHEKYKENKLKEIEDDNKTIRSKIFCTSCGNKIFGDIQFCTKCGTKL